MRPSSNSPTRMSWEKLDGGTAQDTAFRASNLRQPELHRDLAGGSVYGYSASSGQEFLSRGHLEYTVQELHPLVQCRFNFLRFRNRRSGRVATVCRFLFRRKSPRPPALLSLHRSQLPLQLSQTRFSHLNPVQARQAVSSFQLDR